MSTTTQERSRDGGRKGGRTRRRALVIVVATLGGFFASAGVASATVPAARAHTVSAHPGISGADPLAARGGQGSGTPQAPLYVTSTTGTFGTLLNVATSGGSGTGAVTFTVKHGTATGCIITAAIGTLSSTSPGTCVVTAKKAGDGTYDSASSSPTPVSLAAAPPSPPLGPTSVQSDIYTLDGYIADVWGVAVDSSGDLYEVSAQTGEVAETMPDGTERNVGGGWTAPTSVAVDSADNVYVVGGSDQVAKVTPSDKQTAVGSGFEGPYKLAVDSAGNVYVTDDALKDVVEVTPSGEQFVVASGFPEPDAVAVDRFGDVYVSDDISDDVTEITPSGSERVIGSFQFPTGLAVDQQGNLYVADRLTNTVQEVTPSGNQFPVISGLGQATGVALDSAGDVFASDAINDDVVEQTESPNAAISAGPGSATVTWTPPLFDGGSPVTRYKVTATDLTDAAHGGQTCTYKVGSPESDNCTVTRLRGGDSYTFSAKAINRAGASAPSTPSNSVVPTAVTVSSVSPTSGPLAGGTTITIMGAEFVSGAKVTIGQGSGQASVVATDVTVVSSTEITAVTPAATVAGRFSVYVTEAGKTSPSNRTATFTYLAS